MGDQPSQTAANAEAFGHECLTSEEECGKLSHGVHCTGSAGETDFSHKLNQARTCWTMAIGCVKDKRLIISEKIVIYRHV